MKKYVLLLLCLMTSFFAFAKEVKYDAKEGASYVIKWEWELEDDDVQFFRFNINDDNPDYWEYVVDNNVLSYSIRDAKKGEKYTLYLQQSYDGVYWSESAVSTISL